MLHLRSNIVRNSSYLRCSAQAIELLRNQSSRGIESLVTNEAYDKSKVSPPTIDGLKLALRSRNNQAQSTNVRNENVNRPSLPNPKTVSKPDNFGTSRPNLQIQPKDSTSTPFYPHYRDENGKLVPYTRDKYVAELIANGKSSVIPSHVKFAEDKSKRKAKSSHRSNSLQSENDESHMNVNFEVDDDVDDEADIEFTSDFGEGNDLYEDEDEIEDDDQQQRRSSLLEQLELEEQGKASRDSSIKTGFSTSPKGTLPESNLLTPLTTNAELELVFQQAVDRLNLKGLRYNPKLKMWVESSTGLTMTNNDINEAYYESYKMMKKMQGNSYNLEKGSTATDSRSNNNEISTASVDSSIASSVKMGFKHPSVSHADFHNQKKADRPRDADGRRITHTELRQRKHRERFEALPEKSKEFPQREKKFLVASVLEQDYEMFVTQLSHIVNKYVIKHQGPLYKKIDLLLGTIDKQVIDNLDDLHAVQLTYCLGKMVLNRMWRREIDEKKRVKPVTSSDSDKAEETVKQSVTSALATTTTSDVTTADSEKVTYNVSLALTDKSNVTVSDQPKLTPDDIVDLLYHRLLRLQVGLSYTQGLRCLEGMQGLDMLGVKKLTPFTPQRQELLDAVFLSMTGAEFDPSDMTCDRFLDLIRYLSVLKIDWEEVPRSTQQQLIWYLEHYAREFTPQETGALIRQIRLIQWNIRDLADEVANFAVANLSQMLKSEEVQRTLNGGGKLDGTVLQTMIYLLDGIHCVGTQFKELRSSQKTAVITALDLIVKGQTLFQINKALVAVLQIGMKVSDMPPELVDALNNVEYENVKSLMSRMSKPTAW